LHQIKAQSSDIKRDRAILLNDGGAQKDSTLAGYWKKLVGAPAEATLWSQMIAESKLEW
jgi:hypothetical protein